MIKNNVQKIIHKFGTQARVANLLSISESAVSQWIANGVIPARKQQKLLKLADTLEIDLSPADFFPPHKNKGAE